MCGTVSTSTSGQAELLRSSPGRLSKDNILQGVSFNSQNQAAFFFPSRQMALEAYLRQPDLVC